jgi:RNA polymerase sigma factor (TIGR02999 family)
VQLTFGGGGNTFLTRSADPGSSSGERVSELPSEPVAELLRKWRAGDQEALQALIPLVYNELHRLARHYLRGERPDHTLQSTALVHEAYLRLVNQGPFDVQNRAHFVAMAARLMRQILVDHARGHRAAKRGDGTKLALDDAVAFAPAQTVDVIALDDALNDLSRLDERQGRIVELRFFGGLSIEETAGVLGVSPATVKREWAAARAFLSSEMGKTSRP